MSMRPVGVTTSLFDGDGWSLCVSLLALEKLRRGESISSKEIEKLGRTKALVLLLLDPSDERASHRDRERARLLRSHFPRGLSESRKLGGNLDLILAAYSVTEPEPLDEGMLARTQDACLDLLETVNACRARYRHDIGSM